MVKDQPVAVGSIKNVYNFRSIIHVVPEIPQLVPSYIVSGVYGLEAHYKYNRTHYLCQDRVPCQSNQHVIWLVYDFKN